MLLIFWTKIYTPNIYLSIKRGSRYHKYSSILRISEWTNEALSEPYSSPWNSHLKTSSTTISRILLSAVVTPDFLTSQIDCINRSRKTLFVGWPQWFTQLSTSFSLKSNPNSLYEAAVWDTAQNTFTEKLILKDWYKEQGPNRISCVPGYGWEKT